MVYRMAVEHSLLVYRMAVEHSILRRRRSGTSKPGDSVSWHVAILSLCIFNAFRIPFLIQANILHCPSLLTFPMQL